MPNMKYVTATYARHRLLWTNAKITNAEAAGDASSPRFDELLPFHKLCRY
jgi:hypothetical protein